MLCTWARDYGVIGTGIDMSSLFTDQAKRRAEELGIADRVTFIHGDATGYVSDEKVDVAACVGATWIGGGVAGTIDLLARSLRTGGKEGSSSSANHTGGSYRRRKKLLRGVLPARSPTFSCSPNFSHHSGALATTSLKWFWPTKTAGTDTKRPNGSPCADGLKPIPTTGQPKRFEPDRPRNPYAT